MNQDHPSDSSFILHPSSFRSEAMLTLTKRVYVGLVVLAAFLLAWQNSSGRVPFRSFGSFSRPTLPLGRPPTPHYGCLGYCSAPLPLTTTHQYWGCFGYCNGPLNPIRH